MWRCDPPTRIVLAALAGLVASALHSGPLALAAPLAGRPRAAVLAAAALAVLWGGARVHDLELRQLEPGPLEGMVIVTGRPSGDRAVARPVGAGEDVLLEVGHEDEIEWSMEQLDPDSFVIRNSDGDGGADLERTFSLLEEVPAGKVVLSEGGIRHRDQVLALESAGVDAAVLGDWVHELGIGPTFDILRGDSRG